MRKIFGIICALISLFLLYAAIMVPGPGEGQSPLFHFGFFVGQHGPWVVLAAGAYFLLKKRG
jgi:hypothetical protein